MRMEVAEWKRTLVEDTLGNPLILSKIFSFVESVEELKLIRLVCKSWRDASVVEWKAKATLRLLWRRDRCILCKCQDESLLMERTMEVAEYIRSMQGRPFSRYKIVNYCILHPKRDEVDEEVERFWRLYGRGIKFLELDHVTFHCRRHVTGFEWLFMEICTNLEELTLPLDRPPGCAFGEEPEKSMEVDDVLIDAMTRPLSKQIASMKVLHVHECTLSKRLHWIYDHNYWATGCFRLFAFLPNLTTFKLNSNSKLWSDFVLNCVNQDWSLMHYFTRKSIKLE